MVVILVLVALFLWVEEMDNLVDLVDLVERQVIIVRRSGVAQQVKDLEAEEGVMTVQLAGEVGLEK
jgi:hypothetical protein